MPFADEDSVIMTRAYETVRTDRLAFLADEAVPFFRHPQHCSDHRVQWWTDEHVLDQLHPGCPICSGEMLMRMLLLLEAPRIEKLTQKVPALPELDEAKKWLEAAKDVTIRTPEVQR